MNDYSDKDAWEGNYPSCYDLYGGGKELETDIHIHFIDKNDAHTDRLITTKRYVHDDKDGIVYAYCHLRASNRPFQISRISNPIDAETGEIIPNLMTFLDTQYTTSPAGKAEAFIEEHNAAFGALFFIAKADGAFRAKEKLVIDAMCAVFGMTEITVRENVITQISGWYNPSKVEYGRDLKKMLAKPLLYRMRVYAAAKVMIASDKTAKETETAALSRMVKILELPI